ncbi:hypothetical protein SADUNF_Sadunf10G0080400 [Salix dunnii]|uniref:Uncharacterized protein n=1 Tax=Salix dunnii TaxID=1413687 RepID=A0A835JMI6_9ROSI|nr:hypothetical protein SADUNF_Sadunf10G0080400 [Salix dunnii]
MSATSGGSNALINNSSPHDPYEFVLVVELAPVPTLTLWAAGNLSEPSKRGIGGSRVDDAVITFKTILKLGDPSTPPVAKHTI